MTNKEHLREALQSLNGMTPAAVAEHIRKLKIKGRTGTTSRCPLALCLHKTQGATFVVGRKYVARISGRSIAKVRTPRNVAIFVRDFDEGRYPLLMAPAPRCMPPSLRKKDTHNRTNRKPEARDHKREIKNHVAKLVSRFR